MISSQSKNINPTLLWGSEQSSLDVCEDDRSGTNGERHLVTGTKINTNAFVI